MHMRNTLPLFFLTAVAFAQDGSSSPAGKWVSNLKFFEENNYDRLELNLDGAKLSGMLGRNAFEGSYRNGRIEGTVKFNPRTTLRLQGLLEGDRIEGTATIAAEKVEFKWEARREPAKSTAAPAIHTFEPV